ncbi:dynactin 50 kDa subunit [Dictyostelium discoideum AX4]|uniref:Dynactin subunit 2 n=1 Tax=Dictyostelium discoideum TaxID=44689 RepID=DCTN2_DICDI|nr:dynactin 50 kDa subunit [Dictyostelium discoideum AX4]Q54N50.1 RecName: Full=Dynactin subunit 2 [Dictyostelium discoideum]EAL64589.1 dynactin 50 kDa subunit [Dictyostelium discoideum AX4]|eukprot:XP_638093.1 dynactin 50 kDa subunit [Dictyostelium discoideum AX4]
MSEGNQPKRVLGLPDVDPSQQDTFETPDPPESISNLADESSELVNESIDRSSLKPAKSHLKFANRKFNNDNEDFSDSIYKKSVPRTGGLLKNQTVFDILPSDESKVETPLQKFQRLQYEVMSFREEMQVIADNGGEVEKDIKGVDLTHQLADLQNQLSHLLENEKLQPILDENKQVIHYSQIQNNSSKKLISEIESFTQQSLSSSTTEQNTQQPSNNNTTTNITSSSSITPNHVTYELFYTGEQSKSQQLQRIQDLEKRLAKLETATGNKTTDSVPITQSILEIKEKLSLLDTTKIDVLQQKMKTVSKEMESLKIQDETSTKALTTNEKKINDIFETMNKWDIVGQQVPAIINRLYTLRSLHEEGISFSNHVSNLEKQQNDITSLLISNSSLMNKMDDSFKSNLLTIKSNIQQLESRIETLQNRQQQQQQ